LFHHPAFTVQRGRDFSAPDGQGLNENRGNSGDSQVIPSSSRVEEWQREAPRAAGHQGANEGKDSHVGVSGGAATASRALSIGGKSFSIPEQAAALPQKDFEVTKEPVYKEKDVAMEPRLTKGKEQMDTVPIVQMAKLVSSVEGPK
jgi:hypothetical protein